MLVIITLVYTIKTLLFFQGVFRIPKQIVVSEIMPADAALKYYHKHRNWYHITHIYSFTELNRNEWNHG